MSKHTPEPWKYEWSMAGCWLVFCGERKHQTHFAPEREADARLISAAPDLLEALKELTLEMGMTDKARAAIAKAEGRT
jgi:hypothetical protein